MAQLMHPHPTATLFLLFSILILAATSTTTDSGSLVLDVEGNPLEVGTPYYIRTELSKVGIGGGILPASKPNHPQCPQYLAQLALGWEGESPVSFFPTDPSQKQIHISSDLNIIFNTTSSGCPQGPWQLTTDATNGNIYLSTGGVAENLGSQSSASSLKIGKSIAIDGFYQLEYCPTTNDAGNDIVCGVIDARDTTDDNLMVWLGLSTESPNFFHTLSFLKA